VHDVGTLIVASGPRRRQARRLEWAPSV